MTTSTIEITIKGVTGSGKSSLACAIKGILDDYLIPNELIGEDEESQELMQDEWTKRIGVLQRGLVTIKTHRIPGSLPARKSVGEGMVACRPNREVDGKPVPQEDRWIVIPKHVWEKVAARVDRGYFGLRVEGWVEESPHSLIPSGDMVGDFEKQKASLEAQGFEVIENPVWDNWK